MTVSKEAPAPKRSRLSLKGVRKYPPKSTADDTSSWKDPVPSTSTGSSADFPEPRTPEQPIVIPDSPNKSGGSPERRSEKPVIASFNNLGNTCFLNSVLQILRYTPGFVTNLNVLCRELLHVYKQQRAMAEEGETVEASAPWRLVRCLQKLYNKMDRVENDFEEETEDCDLVVQPEKLLDTIRELNPMYEGNFQHDAQELLHCILCFIKDAVQELLQYHDKYPSYKHGDMTPGDLSLTYGHATPAVSHTVTAGGDHRSLPSQKDVTAKSPSNGIVTESVRLGKESLSSLSDAIGDVVINDEVAVENNVVFGTSDVSDYDAPTQPFDDVIRMDTNLNTLKDEDELPPPQGNGFPTMDELFGDESMDSSMKEGRTETVAMEAEPVAKDRINETIDRVLRGETSVDWSREWIQDQDENDFAFNFDNPSDALCEENRAIAESLKDAAAMASVASAISDGKLTPRSAMITPKSSPVRSTLLSTPDTSPAKSESPTTSVVVELYSPTCSLPSAALIRASSSSAAIRLLDEIEVLEEWDENPIPDNQDSVFAQPMTIRGGARRETKISKRSKTSQPVAKVGRKPRKSSIGRGLSVCNGDVNTDIAGSAAKHVEPELTNGFHGKENIPIRRLDQDQDIYPEAKSCARKRTQAKEVVSPVRRSPRKLSQKKDDLELNGRKLNLDPIEVKVNGEIQTWEVEMPSPSDSVRSGPVEEQNLTVNEVKSGRKRVLSPNTESPEPRAKRHSTEDCPNEEESKGQEEPDQHQDKHQQTTPPGVFVKRSVVRRLGMHGAVIRKSSSAEKKVDLTNSSQCSVETEPETDALVIDESVTTHSQEEAETVAEENQFESEAPNTPRLKQSAMDNAHTMRVRLEKCNLKEKYPNLKVSTTPPKLVTFDCAPCRLVENLFEGRVALRTRCMECEGSSDRVESFQDVSVPVKKQVGVACEEKQEELSDDEDSVCTPQSAHWMLKELSEVEHLRDENKYFCEACQQLVEAERSTHYDVMPKILTLHLKRFAATAGFFGGLSKITDHVSIPLSLPCFSAQCVQPCTAHSYELYGLVMHSGVTITSGHYVSYVRLNADVIKPRDDVTKLPGDVESRLIPKWSLEGRWIECDDDQVKVLSDRDFDHVLSESNFGTPYVLFYSLCGRSPGENRR